MQDIQGNLKKFKVVVAILIAGIAIFAILLKSVVPTAIQINKINNESKTAKTNIVDKERQLQNLKDKLKKEQEEQSSTTQLKAFFRPIEQGMDTEAVIANEFSEILVLIRNNSVKTRSIKYDYDPQDDNFVKNVPDKYNVARLDMEMIATYRNFENLLKDLYKHEHFLEISSVEIVPYSKNKRILVIKLQIKLYAQK